MAGASKDIKRDLKRNRPSLIAPILNTILAVIVIVIAIIMKVSSKDFSWALFISFMIVMTLFPIVSWYYSFFSKKQKTKMLYSYEKETELIVEFMQHRKNFKEFTESDKIKVTASFNLENITNKFKYNVEKSSLGFPSTDNSIVSIGIGFTGLEIDPTTKEVIGISGLLPRSIWLKKHLKTPKAKSGIVKIDAKGVDLRNKTYIGINKQSDTYYDKKTGWICIGDVKTYDFDDTIEFLKDAYLVLRDGNIISLWLKLGENLPLM